MPERGILSWMTSPSPGRGIHFLSSGGRWDFRSYQHLAEASSKAARSLVAAGIGPADIVVLSLPTGWQAVATFFGILTLGATPVFVAPPSRFSQSMDGVSPTAGSTSLDARLIIAESGADLASTWAQVTRLDVNTLFESPPDVSVRSSRPPEGSIVQFTSGSSGAGRPVMVSLESLTHSTRAIRDWLAWRDTDIGISWLPLHHDMGLVGCLLTCVEAQTSLWLLDAERFVRSPTRFLQHISDLAVTLCAMPNFALDFIVRRTDISRMSNVDLSRWRALIIGGERVRPATLQRFAEHLAPVGFGPASLLPAYGMAEATCAITGVSPGTGWTTRPGDRALVNCGKPLLGLAITIEGEDGVPVAAGQVGEIVVRGPIVNNRYLDADAASATAFGSGGLKTGDAGCLIEGDLYVHGRMGDGLKLRGQMLFAEALEIFLEKDYPTGTSIVALLGWFRDAATIAILLDSAAVEACDSVSRLVKRYAGEDTSVHVIQMPARRILRTSSGKPRRREMWQLFTTGRLGA